MEGACDMRNTYNILIRKGSGKEHMRIDDEIVNLETSRLLFGFQLMVYEKHGSCVNRKR